MKKILFTVILSLMSFFTFSQKVYNFYGFGFDYVTNSTAQMSDLLKNGGTSKSVMRSNGFNLFEVDLDNKIFTHDYVNEDGLSAISKITNIQYTQEYVKFDVSTKDFGVLNCMISLNESSKYDFVVKYKKGSDTRVAMF